MLNSLINIQWLLVDICKIDNIIIIDCKNIGIFVIAI